MTRINKIKELQETENLKMVKEFAAELNVAAQTVYRYLKKIDQEKYTRVFYNSTHITEEGQELIKSLKKFNDEKYKPKKPVKENEKTKDERIKELELKLSHANKKLHIMMRAFDKVVRENHLISNTVSKVQDIQNQTLNELSLVREEAIGEDNDQVE